ncbi:MAG: hypothetical protein DHS20C21_22250 [Gemmatimonadota bacterium]|nr:MAG: hypothetical protein DHS20C21_22250 [Gemmatimonadota bacterium]
MLAALLCVFGASSAHAAESKIFLSGHSFVDGAFPQTEPTKELQAVGIINQIRQPLFWSPFAFSYTWHARGLISLGATVIGTTYITDYMGGEFSIHVDTLPSNHDYGVYPTSATVPSTFTDGHGVYLEGFFESCTVTYNTATGSGSYAAEVTFTGGNAYPALQDPTGWALGATITGFSPAGYCGEINGAMFVEGPLDQEEASWGDIKALYR